jgi:hypothetical protein
VPGRSERIIQNQIIYYLNESGRVTMWRARECGRGREEKREIEREREREREGGEAKEAADQSGGEDERNPGLLFENG